MILAAFCMDCACMPRNIPIPQSLWFPTSLMSFFGKGWFSWSKFVSDVRTEDFELWVCCEAFRCNSCRGGQDAGAGRLGPLSQTLGSSLRTHHFSSSQKGLCIAPGWQWYDQCEYQCPLMLMYFRTDVGSYQRHGTIEFCRNGKAANCDCVNRSLVTTALTQRNTFWTDPTAPLLARGT
jgi:hypothetical protein